MSWFSSAGPGDWVRTTRPLALSLTDMMLGQGGLPEGTRGVVVSRSGSRLAVELESGGGRTSATLRPGDIRVVRRSGGIETFRRRSDRLARARLAVAVVLLLPVLQFVAAYWWAHRSFDGVVAGFVMAALYGAEDSLLASLHQPARALVYFAVVTGLWRFAFGRKQTS